MAIRGIRNMWFDDFEDMGGRRRRRAPEDCEDAERRAAELQQRLEESNKQSEEYKALAQRLQADFLNFKRRTEQEREEQARQSQAGLMLKLLPLLDDFERAMDSLRADVAGLHWVQGVGHIYRKMQAILESEGLTRIEALGQDFDPRLHEAITYEQVGEDEDGKVLSVLQNGYKLRDRVIRPAMVKVGKASKPHRASQGEQQLGASFLEED
ncbi:MAG: nucleotide exchange factor GrpE [Chloroflexota bacterium]